MPEKKRAPGSIPLVLAGPMLRKLTTTQLTLWLATRSPVDIQLELLPESGLAQSYALSAHSDGYRCLSASPHLHYHLLSIELSAPLPTDCLIQYQLKIRPVNRADGRWLTVADWAPDLCYPGQELPGFRLTSHVDAVLHGSCRKPHHAGGDGLIEADRLLTRFHSEPSDITWPSMLIMSGDQIYADDVAGPMLSAIHQLIDVLELPSEAMVTLETDGLSTSQDLYQHAETYYRRESLLPESELNKTLVDVVFGGARKPVFTSVNAHNHLITLGEFLAMYLLCWSPVPWQLVNNDIPSGLSDSELALYQKEQQLINEFKQGLTAVRRLMAHVPVAMIFDDHDVSDDWNLNRDWEEKAYGHPLSQRMIGNGLLAYLINQGWGNNPADFPAQMLDSVQRVLKTPGSESYDEFLHELLAFEQWDFEWPTDPVLIVLDTRTRRWRSESSAHKPSGLIDWEALTDLQHRLRGHDAVLLVSAGPIFGVKLIEVIQKLVTLLGKPLMVDAENWMAHPGTANGILNVFQHKKTPQHFVVLSGDVHYSFVYDVELRQQHSRYGNAPEIWQICSSALRNSFPERLLNVLDRLNRTLYSPRSPLNWFTRRRKMRITPRKPLGTSPGRRLLNQPGIGLVELDNNGRPQRICQLVSGGKIIEFERREAESNWH